MGGSQSGQEILDREFLPTRAKILEIAATLDRISRAAGSAGDDPRWAQLQDATKILLEAAENRAERVQLLFSREYDENWRETLAVT